MAGSNIRVLVTGGLGFIGSNLVRELKRRGYEVWVCDLMHSDMENYIRCDISKYQQVKRMFEDMNIPDSRGYAPSDNEYCF